MTVIQVPVHVIRRDLITDRTRLAALHGLRISRGRRIATARLLVVALRWGPILRNLLGRLRRGVVRRGGIALRAWRARRLPLIRRRLIIRRRLVSRRGSSCRRRIVRGRRLVRRRWRWVVLGWRISRLLRDYRKRDRARNERHQRSKQVPGHILVTPDRRGVCHGRTPRQPPPLPDVLRSHADPRVVSTSAERTGTARGLQHYARHTWVDVPALWLKRCGRRGRR